MAVGLSATTANAMLSSVSAWYCRLGVDRTREDGSEADCFAVGALCAWED
jgi:hypothetical protein